jgi:hypothetical protein
VFKTRFRAFAFKWVKLCPLTRRRRVGRLRAFLGLGADGGAAVGRCRLNPVDP